MIYESTHCYPDLIDLRQVLNKNFRGRELPAEDLYQDFRTSFEWLQLAIRGSRWAGKHKAEPLVDIKAIAEGYVGRVLHRDAFLVASFFRGE